MEKWFKDELLATIKTVLENNGVKYEGTPLPTEIANAVEDRIEDVYPYWDSSSAQC